MYERMVWKTIIISHQKYKRFKNRHHYKPTYFITSRKADSKSKPRTCVTSEPGPISRQAKQVHNLSAKRFQST